MEHHIEAPTSPAELSAQLGSLNNRGHTQTALLATAQLENWLQIAIESRFEEKPTKLIAMLFSPRGSLGSFAPKIDFAFALSSISEETWTTLHVLRAIQHKLAHTLAGSNFDHPELTEHFNALGREPSRELRFLQAVVRCIEDINMDMQRRALMDRVRRRTAHVSEMRERSRR